MIHSVKIQAYKQTLVSTLITEKTSILSEGKQFTQVQEIKADELYYVQSITHFCMFSYLD